MDTILEPIVVLGMPRSGSSLTAGLFQKHGVWVGRCRSGDNINPKGYYENLDFKEELIRRFGRLAQTTTPAKEHGNFRQFAEKLAPKNKKWLVKHSAMYRRAWDQFKPHFICVRRNIDGIIGSNKKTNFLGTRDESRMLEIIDAHHKEMNLSGGVSVFVDRLMEGDFTSIENALEYCGIEPDRAKIADFVEPSLWKRWSQ